MYWYEQADASEVYQVLTERYRYIWDGEKINSSCGCHPDYIYKRAVNYAIAEQLWWENSDD